MVSPVRSYNYIPVLCNSFNYNYVLTNTTKEYTTEKLTPFCHWKHIRCYRARCPLFLLWHRREPGDVTTLLSIRCYRARCPLVFVVAGLSSLSVVTGRDVLSIRCYRARCPLYPLLQGEMSSLSVVTGWDVLSIRCYRARCPLYPLLQGEMSSLSVVAGRDVLSIRCYRARCPLYPLLQGEMSSLSVVAGRDVLCFCCGIGEKLGMSRLSSLSLTANYKLYH